MGIIIFLLVIFTSPSAMASGACAHRGDSMNAPENTLPAIVSAVSKGAHQIEIDVKISKDGKLVIMHDWTVDRTTDGSGKVSDLTLKQLKALDAGRWFGQAFKGIKIPTLREALDAIPHEILCNVHVHGGPEVTAPVAVLIDEMGHLDHCFLTLGSDEDEGMAAARAAVEDIKICKGHPADKKINTENIVIAEKTLAHYRKLHQLETIEPRIDFIQLFSTGPFDLIKDTIDKLHSNGIKVNYCCANTDEKIRLLNEAGVDYIMTDNLDLCLRILSDCGIKPVNVTVGGKKH